MISEQRKQEVVRTLQVSFKRDNAKEIAMLTLSELRDTDAMLGDRDLNAGFRIALRNRMKELEDREAKRHESHVRVVGYVVSFCLGVLATLVTVWLT